MEKARNPLREHPAQRVQVEAGAVDVGAAVDEAPWGAIPPADAAHSWSTAAA